MPSNDPGVAGIVGPELVTGDLEDAAPAWPRCCRAARRGRRRAGRGCGARARGDQAFELAAIALCQRGEQRVLRFEQAVAPRAAVEARMPRASTSCPRRPAERSPLGPTGSGGNTRDLSVPETTTGLPASSDAIRRGPRSASGVTAGDDDRAELCIVCDPDYPDRPRAGELGAGHDRDVLSRSRACTCDGARRRYPRRGSLSSLRMNTRPRRALCADQRRLWCAALAGVAGPARAADDPAGRGTGVLTVAQDLHAVDEDAATPVAYCWAGRRWRGQRPVAGSNTTRSAKQPAATPAAIH